MTDSLFSGSGGSAKYSREEIEAAGPQVFEMIDAAPLTIYSLQGALYDAERAGLGTNVDITDYVKAKAAVNNLKSGPGDWSAAGLALVLHLEHLKFTLRERA